jgi:hypothetical protein
MDMPTINVLNMSTTLDANEKNLLFVEVNLLFVLTPLRHKEQLLITWRWFYKQLSPLNPKEWGKNKNCLEAYPLHTMTSRDT